MERKDQLGGSGHCACRRRWERRIWEWIEGVLGNWDRLVAVLDGRREKQTLTIAAQPPHLPLPPPDVPRRRRRRLRLRLVQASPRPPRSQVRFLPCPSSSSPSPPLTTTPNKQRVRPREDVVAHPPPPRPAGRGGPRPGPPLPRRPEAREGAAGRERQGLPLRPLRAAYLRRHPHQGHQVDGGPLPF